MTRGDEMVAAARSSHGELRRLTRVPYAREDVSRIIDPFGSRLEAFLRTSALPMASRKDKLFQLINRLAGHGVDQPTIDRLHDLRALYNDSKHDPAKPLLLTSAINVLDNAGR